MSALEVEFALDLAQLNRETRADLFSRLAKELDDDAFADLVDVVVKRLELESESVKRELAKANRELASAEQELARQRSQLARERIGLQLGAGEGE